MSNREILERALDAFADPARRHSYFDLYSEDVVLHGYDGVEPGRQSVRRFYAALWSASPDAAVRVEDIFECGDKLAVRFVMTGTHRGEFNGVPASGRPVSLPGITILRFADGKCVERWSVADFLKLMAQIGALR